MKILIVSPHLDDAAFSLSLTIARWLSDGHQTGVLNCFTHSEYAPHLQPPDFRLDAQQSRVTAVRRQEDEAWCHQIGIGQNRIDLRLEDAPLRLRCSSKDVCNVAVEADSEALHNIQSYFKHSESDVFVLPMAIGGHVDHVTARDAVMAIGVAGFPCAFYEDLPYAARPRAAEAIPYFAAQLSFDLKPHFVERPRNVRSAMDRKKELLLLYQSQIDNTEADEIAGFCARYGGRERLWVNEAWRGCPLAQEDEGC